MGTREIHEGESRPWQRNRITEEMMILILMRRFERRANGSVRKSRY